MAIVQSCKEALQAILNLVDYTDYNCSPGDAVEAVLPRSVIRAAKDAIVFDDEKEYHRKQKGEVEQEDGHKPDHEILLYEFILLLLAEELERSAESAVLQIVSAIILPGTPFEGRKGAQWLITTRLAKKARGNR